MTNINEYLKKLKESLKGCDISIIHDALSDAEEHLNFYITNAMEENKEISYEEALTKAIEDFGTAEEIADDYHKIDNYLSPIPKNQTKEKAKSSWKDFFLVIADPRAWGAVLYMIFSLLTGIIFFTWTITGISLSLSLMILIIGLPVAGLYLLSIRGIALIEGRIVEALLGVRMPRRSVFIKPQKGIWNRFKELLSSGVTWKAQIYMLFQLIFGIAYFSFIVTLLSVSLGLISTPILRLISNESIVINSNVVYLEEYITFLGPIFGIFLFFVSLHLAKLIGKFHGWFAKIMLVHV